MPLFSEASSSAVSVGEEESVVALESKKVMFVFHSTINHISCSYKVKVMTNWQRPVFSGTNGLCFGLNFEQKY